VPETLTLDEAIAALPEGDRIHTYLNPAAGMMLGADWDRAEVLRALRESPEIRVTGDMAQSMGHGIAVWERNRIVFIATSRRTDGKEPPDA